MGLHQIKNILHNKGNYQQNENTTYGMVEEICNDIFNKGLISKVYRTQYQKKKTQIILLANGKDLNRHFSRKIHIMAKRHMKRCLTSLIIWKCKSNHSELLPHICQMIILKKIANNKCWGGCGEKRTLCTVEGNLYCGGATVENSIEIYLKKKRHNYHKIQQFHSFRCFSEENKKTLIQKIYTTLCPLKHVIYRRQDMEGIKMSFNR